MQKKLTIRNLHFRAGSCRCVGGKAWRWKLLLLLIFLVLLG